MESRLSELFKKEDDYEILEKLKGKALEQKTYKALFPYFAHLKEKGAFRILCDNYVTEDSGTGVVHQAPYFGEDDYRYNSFNYIQICFCLYLIILDK